MPGRTSAPPSSGASGAAGGDLGGSYPNPTVVTINGRAVSAVVFSDNAALTNSRAPNGAAGGVLGGTYPNPSFAADMATQAELDTHGALTTTAHGGIVASWDSRLTDSRAPNGAAGGDLAGTFPNPTVGAGTISDSQIASAAAIAYSKLALAGAIGNADIATAAAIAYSKLALTGSVTNADIAAGAAIAKSKLAALGIVNADVDGAAAIAYSKLALTGSLVNADVNAAAAIAYSKLNLTGSVVGADHVDQTVGARYLTDFARTGGWLPAGAFAETVPHRQGVASSALLTSGTMYLYGGIVVPGGRAVSSITFRNGGGAATLLTSQWFALYDKATLALLATTTDDGATAWGTGTKTLQLATALRGATPGGTWTPTNATEVYLACLVTNTGTMPQLSCSNATAGTNGIAPIIAGTSTTGIAAGIANVPDPAGALTAIAGLAYGYLA